MGYEGNAGIIPRLCAVLFERIASKTCPSWQASVLIFLYRSSFLLQKISKNDFDGFSYMSKGFRVVARRSLSLVGNVIMKCIGPLPILNAVTEPFSTVFILLK